MSEYRTWYIIMIGWSLAGLFNTGMLIFSLIKGEISVALVFFLLSLLIGFQGNQAVYECERHSRTDKS